VTSRTAYERSCEAGHRRGLNGSAEDLLDLDGLLPAPWNRSSAADVAVDERTLRILGTAGHLVTESIGDVVRAEQIVLWEGTLAD
jgi:hypothetical protein